MFSTSTARKCESLSCLLKGFRGESSSSVTLTVLHPVPILAAVLPAVTGLIRILSSFNIWCLADKNQWYSEYWISVQISIILFCLYSEASETSEPSRAKRPPQTCNEVSRRAQQGRERHGLRDNFPTHPESPVDGQSARYHYQHHYYHFES